MLGESRSRSPLLFGLLFISEGMGTSAATASSWFVPSWNLPLGSCRLCLLIVRMRTTPPPRNGR